MAIGSWHTGAIQRLVSRWTASGTSTTSGVDKVRSLVADRTHAATFLCGGSRNFSKFIHLFDAVFVLEVDLPTLHRRLDERPDEEWGGRVPTERELIVQWHQTKQDVPENGIAIDATAPLEQVVDEILRRCEARA